MPRKYQRIEDKIKGVVPVEGMGATVHIDKYVVPCTVVSVGSTDRRMPMVGIQIDKTGNKEFIRDTEGVLMLFTYRKTDEWRQYGYGFKSGARLELGIRRSRDYADADSLEDADAVTDAVKGCGPHADAVEDAVTPADRLRMRLRTRDLK